MVYDVIIVGLGASGISASIYAKRSGLNVLVINYSVPGGVINESSIVENYPGFMSITGTDLSFKFFEHFNSLNIPLITDEVIDIKDGNLKRVITKNSEYKSKFVIICTGRKPKRLRLLNEEKYIGNGISYCPVCDGNLYKNKDVCVVGGGNSALESVLYLSKLCNKVYLLVRNERVRGDKILLDKIITKKNVQVCYNSSINDLIISSDKITGVKVEAGIIDVSGIFVNIGYEPSINILKSLDIELENGYIIVDKNMQTNIKGIYACGDAIKKDLYQIVTAVSDGATAANHISNNIEY